MMTYEIEYLELEGKEYQVITLENENGSWTFAGEEPYNLISNNEDSCFNGGRYGEMFDAEVYYYTDLVEMVNNGKLSLENFVKELICEDKDFESIFAGL